MTPCLTATSPPPPVFNALFRQHSQNTCKQFSSRGDTYWLLHMRQITSEFHSSSMLPPWLLLFNILSGDSLRRLAESRRSSNPFMMHKGKDTTRILIRLKGWVLGLNIKPGKNMTIGICINYFNTAKKLHRHLLRSCVNKLFV